MDVLKSEKENGKVFHWNILAQIISEICGKEGKEPAPVLNWGRKSIFLDDFEQVSLFNFDVFFLQTITTTYNIRYDIGRMQPITRLSRYE